MQILSALFHRPPAASSVPERSRQALEAMLAPGNSPEERQEVLEVASAYRPEVLERLREDGYRISYTDRFPVHIGGLHDPDRRTVEISRGWQGQSRRRALLHELAHALDAVRYREQVGWLEARLSLSGRHYASETDPRLEALYRDYLLRSAVDDALVSRDLILEKSGRSVRQPARLTLRDGDSSFEATFTPAQGGDPPVLTSHRTVPRKWLSRVLLPLAVSTAGVAAAVAGGVPLLAVAAAAWGGVRLARGLGEIREAGRFADSVGTVRRRKGEVLRVDIRDGHQRVELPSDDRSEIEAMWSHYATRARWIPEYFAEGVAFYLESPEQRRLLAERDPGLYRYLEEQHLAG